MVKPLDDIRVVSLGQIYQGGYCTLLLSYMGAEVIKVEPPWGENLRARSADGQPPNFQFLNASKKSVTLDIKSDAGQKAILELVEDSDVFVQNYRPGKLEKLGLGYEDLKVVNPEIVYAHGSGYGDSGPYADRPAMDLTIQAISGIVDATGFPEEKPVKAGPAIGDFLGAVHLTVGILGALRARDRTGEGEYVDVGMMDCLYPTLASQMAKIARDDDIPSRTGNQHPGGTLAPYNVYEVADGYVAIICVTDAQWERLATVMDRPDVLDDDRFATKIERGKNREAVNEVIRE
jgi:crotonobetainyl-CoA:carnitine CoA-transferase CaiB-like acyl-CoA transferase